MGFAIKSMNHNDPVYLRCCNNIHVTDVSLFLAYLGVGVNVFGFCVTIAGQPLLVWLNLMLLILNILTIKGIKSMNHHYLLPTLVIDAVAWFAHFTMSSLAAIAVFVNSAMLLKYIKEVSQAQAEITLGLLAFILVVWFAYTAFLTWVVLVDYGSYKYIKERSAVHTVSV